MNKLKKIWEIIGIAGFWVGWPLMVAIFRLLKTERTRLLIVNGQSVLVVKNWFGNGKWSLPGGGVRKDEAPADAVRRELKEEVGLALAEDQVVLLSSGQYKERGLQFNCHYFLAKLAWQAPIRPVFPEISDVAWVDMHAVSLANANADVLTAITEVQSKNLLQ